VVEHSPHHLIVKGSSLSTSAASWRVRRREVFDLNCFNFYMIQHFSSYIVFEYIHIICCQNNKIFWPFRKKWLRIIFFLKQEHFWLLWVICLMSWIKSNCLCRISDYTNILIFLKLINFFVSPRNSSGSRKLSTSTIANFFTRPPALKWEPTVLITPSKPGQVL